jgi:hypothetical protein
MEKSVSICDFIRANPPSADRSVGNLEIITPVSVTPYKIQL